MNPKKNVRLISFYKYIHQAELLNILNLFYFKIHLYLFLNIKELFSKSYKYDYNKKKFTYFIGDF